MIIGGFFLERVKHIFQNKSFKEQWHEAFNVKHGKCEFESKNMVVSD